MNPFYNFKLASPRFHFLQNIQWEIAYGGINEKNAFDAISAGANILVAGSAVFKAQDRKSAIDVLRQ